MSPRYNVKSNVSRRVNPCANETQFAGRIAFCFCLKARPTEGSSKLTKDVPRQMKMCDYWFRHWRYRYQWPKTWRGGVNLGDAELRCYWTINQKTALNAWNKLSKQFQGVQTEEGMVQEEGNWALKPRKDEIRSRVSNVPWRPNLKCFFASDGDGRRKIISYLTSAACWRPRRNSDNIRTSEDP